MANMGRCGKHGSAFSVRLINGQRDEYCPECEVDRLRAEVRRLREQEQTIRLEMARDALNESEDLAGRLNAVLADAGIVVDTTYDVAFRTLLHQRDAALAERDAARQEAEAAKATHDATAQRYNAAMDRLLADKDAMSQDGSHIRAALTEARRVLREVEWVSQYGKITGPSIPEWAWCPCCGKTRQDDHTPADCALAAVLAQEEPS